MEMAHCTARSSTCFTFVACILLASLLVRADVKVGSRADWAAFKDDPLYLEVRSPSACKVLVDGKLQGWMPGGAEARCFKLVSGRGWRPVHVVAAEINAEIAAEFVPTPDGRKMADALCSDVAARCVEGDRWLYSTGFSPASGWCSS